jgi:hypothetical protein
VNPQVFISINLRLVSNETAEFGDVFDCEDLMMVLDGAVGMSTALDVNTSGVRYVEEKCSPEEIGCDTEVARSLDSRGNLPAPASGTCRLAGVEPCRGPRREITELASCISSCSSCVCA